LDESIYLIGYIFRFLVSGDQQKSIAKNYRVGRSTVCKIIHETVIAIYEALQPICLKVPDVRKWKEIASGFEEKWQFPHCVGALDGKHFNIPAPPNSGSLYHNYKVINLNLYLAQTSIALNINVSFQGRFSVVLLATCDADYNFTTITVGSAGSESDGGIFQRSSLGRKVIVITI
jgi:DDE superfamily endonuclease